MSPLAAAPWQRRRLVPLAALLGLPPPPTRQRNPSHLRWRRPPSGALRRSEVLGYGDCWVAIPRRRRWSKRQWWSWLAGLVDGDGHLATTRQGGVLLAVAGNGPELAVLGRVRQLLGAGSIGRSGWGALGRVYQLSHPEKVRHFLEHCGPLLRNPLRRRQARKVGRRLGMPLNFSEEPADDSWRMGFLEADGCVTIGGRGQHLEVSGSNTQRVLLEHFGGTFGGGWTVSDNGGNGRQMLHKRSLATATDASLRRLVRRLGVVPSAGPKGAKLRLLPRHRGLRRAKAHRAAVPDAAAARWTAFMVLGRSLRGVAPARAGYPPLEPRFRRLPPLPRGPALSRRQRRRLALLVAAGGRLGLRHREGRYHLRLTPFAAEGDEPLLQRLRRRLKVGFRRRSRRPALEISGAKGLHGLALLVAPHWLWAQRRG